MPQLTCDTCGRTVEYDVNDIVAECSYCGMSQAVPGHEDEAKKYLNNLEDASVTDRTDSPASQISGRYEYGPSYEHHTPYPIYPEKKLPEKKSSSILKTLIILLIFVMLIVIVVGSIFIF